MTLKNEIESILFNIGKEIKVHKLLDGNLVIDIEYEKYVEELIKIFDKYKN